MPRAAGRADRGTGELLIHAVRRAREMGFVAIDSASAGAYGASMASTYNCRVIAPEVLVDGNRYATVSERIAADRVRKQRLAPWMEEGVSTTCAA